jgi:putative hydrolase of the HAD superfamily
LKTLVFDFGNVVAHFDHRLTTNRLAPYAGISADALHKELFGPLEKEYDAGRISTVEFLARVRESCRLTCADDFFAWAWADIFWPNSDLIALLPALKKRYRLILASNTNELHTRQFCKQFEVALKNFDKLVFSHDVGARKPDRRFFDHCLGLAGCCARECLFIDDLADNVTGARACGWNAILYRDFGQLQADFLVHGIEITAQVPAILSSATQGRS